MIINFAARRRNYRDMHRNRGKTAVRNPRAQDMDEVARIVADELIAKIHQLIKAGDIYPELYHGWEEDIDNGIFLAKFREEMEALDNEYRAEIVLDILSVRHDYWVRLNAERFLEDARRHVYVPLLLTPRGIVEEVYNKTEKMLGVMGLKVSFDLVWERFCDERYKFLKREGINDYMALLKYLSERMTKTYSPAKKYASLLFKDKRLAARVCSDLLHEESIWV